MLVADWVAASTPGRVVWVTVEREDGAPGVFWADVLEAVRRRGIALPDDIDASARAVGVDRSLLLRLAAHLDALALPVVLVIDEFERVGCAEVADDLHYLLGHAGAGLRLVLISRTEPLLPLHRYRAAGEIAEICGADLAFTPLEAEELLRLHGLELSGDVALTLAERTEGWAAGLRLCALAAQQAEDPTQFLMEFEACGNAVADFLLAEVYQTQPAEVRDLLLRTSILQRTSAELADALTERRDAARILTELPRANAFIEPIGHGWYRHHPMFAEVLRFQLRARLPVLEAEMHRRAAHWLCDLGLLAEALPHAAAAGDWEFAAARFVDDLAIGRLFVGPEAERLRELFGDLAPEAAGMAAEIVRAGLAIARREVGNGLAHLEHAEKLLPEDAATSAPAAALSCAFLRVLVGRLVGSAQLASRAAAAAGPLEQQVPADRLRSHPELHGLLETELGAAFLWAGRFDEARAVLSHAAEVGAGSPPTRPFALSRLALTDLLCGSPGRAEAQARNAVLQAERLGLPPASRPGAEQLVLALGALDRDDPAAAHAGLADAASSSEASHDPTMLTGIAILRARLLLADGDPSGALEVLDALARTPSATYSEEQSPWAQNLTAVVRSAAHLANGDSAAAAAAVAARSHDSPECAVALAQAQLAEADAVAALATLDADATDTTMAPVLAVRAQLARAQAAACLGDEAAARKLLAQSLRTARPDRLRGPFREVGPWLQRVLRADRGLGGARDWLPDDLLAAPPRPGAVPEPALGLPVDPLSEREHDVLECAAQLMSTKEIADDLCLSVNTVKTHLKSINRKLCVNRRGEAVRRARQLRVL